MKSPIGPTAGTTQSRAKILIIEDQGVIALDLSEMVADWGHSVIGIARDTEEAFLWLKHEKADVVLMDIDFPDMDAGLTAMLRFQRSIGVPVICMTACRSKDLGPASALTEPYGFVPKPIDPNDLATLICRVLRCQRERGPS